MIPTQGKICTQCRGRCVTCCCMLLLQIQPSSIGLIRISLEREALQTSKMSDTAVSSLTVNGLLFPASPFVFFCCDPPGSGAQWWCGELICNYLKQLVKYELSGQPTGQQIDVSFQSQWLNWIYVEFKFILFKTKPTSVVVKSIALPATMFKHLKVNIKQTSI